MKKAYRKYWLKLQCFLKRTNPYSAIRQDSLGAVMADLITGTVLTFVGLPGLMPLPWWQKVIIGSAATVAFSAAAKAMEYFIQEIEEPLHKKQERIVMKRRSGR